MDNEIVVPNSLPDYKSEIANIIKSNLSPVRIREKLEDYHENDIAASLSELSETERKKLYSLIGSQTLADILEYADEPSKYLGELSVRRRVEMLARIETTMAVQYLEGIDKKERNTIIELMPEETRQEITLLASFDKDEIGSRMTTNYIAIRNGLEIRQAMSELIRQAAEKDNVSTIYVLDENDIFVGAIDLKDLIRARSGGNIEDIIMSSYPYVYSHELIEDCIDRIRGYSEDSVPVLDTENRLCGVLTALDVSDLIEDEIEDDYAKLGGLSAEEDLREPLTRSIGKRLPWLIVLFGLGLIVSTVVGLFDTVVSNLTLIVSFQSLILGMAGNVGTQSLAVTIRSLSDETLDGKQKFHLVFKEARVGLCNGLILGSMSFALIGAYLFFVKGISPSLAFSVSLCTGIALAVAMLLSSISGTSIPMIFKKLKIDPAVASGPFITTINDLVAVVTYYGLAWLLLIGFLI